MTNQTINKVVKMNFQGVPWMVIFSMLLVTLKAFGKFPFAWIWTIAPLWAPVAGSILVVLAILAIGAVLFLGALAVFGIGEAWGTFKRWRSRRKRGLK